MTNVIIKSLTSDVNEDLRKFLERYCTSAISPGYAVMLRGPWGSGKTWFVDDFRERLKSLPDKRSLYVSLFGVSKPADIQDQFFAQIHPKLANEKVQKLWGIGKSLLKATVKIDWDGDGKDDGSLQISMPDLGKWASTSGAIIIFDDLERVGMPLADIFGYINQFVEHEGYRVIVIANEEKCTEKEPGFPTMKEKVIGRTFEILPNFNDALASFLQEIVASDAFTILYPRRDIILKVFSRAKYGNLRQLRQAILDFYDFISCLQLQNSTLNSRQDFLDRLVEDIFSISIEYRSGALGIDHIRTYEMLGNL